jgi:hypothetical protein
MPKHLNLSSGLAYFYISVLFGWLIFIWSHLEKIYMKKVVRGISTLRKIVKKIPPNKIVLLMAGMKDYQKVNFETLRIVIEENKFSGIYITVNRPYVNLKRLIAERGIDVSKIFFIDCISKMIPAPAGITFVKKAYEIKENCLFIPSPTQLTELALALTQAMARMKEPANKFLFLDSLSTLLIYSDVKTVVKFVHFLATRVRLLGIVGIMICTEKVSGGLLASLMEICDMVMEVKV